jgi:hypothetical protein
MESEKDLKYWFRLYDNIKKFGLPIEAWKGGPE